MKLVEAHYGGYPRGQIEAETPRPEPVQTAERRVTTQQPTASHRLAIGYRSPAMGHADHAPLVLLNEVLFGGPASRIHRDMVEEKEIASNVGGYVGNFRDPSLYDVYVSGRAEHGCGELLQAIDVQMDRILREPASADEVARASARMELELLRGSDSVGGKAEQIGFCELVLDDPAAMWTRLEAYRRVTVDDVARVAERYLTPDARTVVEVTPSHGDAS